MIPDTLHLAGELALPANRPDDPAAALAAAAPGAALIRILKRSIDARSRRSVVIRYRLLVSAGGQSADKLKRLGFAPYDEAESSWQPGRTDKRVVIVGAGPAGLFCALRLASCGAAVTVLERGKRVEERMKDIARLERDGVLDPESNAVFGEGGAGTYSDGKLTSRIHRGDISWFFSELVLAGAPDSILYEAKPHLGTDVLAGMVRNIRRKIESLGGEIRFSCRVDRLLVRDGAVIGVGAGHEEFPADAVVLALGHSARDTITSLSQQGLALEKKGFALGARIEHPAEFINRARYGSFAPHLGAADYSLAWTDPSTGRGVYSFCMCPGGQVVNSSSEPEALCVNGMSMAARNAAWSNAALVVAVRPEDMPGDVLAAFDFQRGIERAAYSVTDSFIAPAMRAADLVSGRVGADVLPASSYLNGIVSHDCRQLFPEFIVTGLRRGLNEFSKKIHGFADEGILIGVETRTSSPVRMRRDVQCRAEGFTGLYVAGEGAGYAGGIVSSAVDGIRAADSIAGS